MRRADASVGSWRACGWALCLIVMILLASCAAEPLSPAREVRPTDLKSLAGTWEWSSWFQTPARLGPGPMTVRLEGGKLLFETKTTSGAFSLYEGATKRVLKGDGADKAGGSSFSIELTQRARHADRSAGEGNQTFVLIVVE